jgi:Putative beta-barrel porin 2
MKLHSRHEDAPHSTDTRGVVSHRHPPHAWLVGFPSPEFAWNLSLPASRLHGARAGLVAAMLPLVVATWGQAQILPLTSVTPAPALKQPAPDEWGVTLPAWLSAASLSVKEGYDSNIYGVSDNLPGHPAIANISSMSTTLSASFALNLLAAFEPQDGGFLKDLTLAYSADYAQYAAAPREDNLRNTLTFHAAGKAGPWSLVIDNTLLYVDGSKEDEFFNFYNNLGYGVVRERRNQVQERNTSFLRYDATDWFIRAVYSASYYNLLIDEHNPVGAYKGYANWINRDDVNAGLDLGYNVAPNFALVAGWRLGSQVQAHYYYSLVADDSTYNRALLGFEGKPLSWLQTQILAGPDYRRYSNAAHLGLTGDRHTWFYLKGQLAADLTPADTLTASARVWHFVSSAGVASIQETIENLTYRHEFTRQLSASVGLNELGHRYDAPTVRDDWTTAVPVDVTYAMTRDLSVSAGYSATSGHSHYPVAVTPGQNFEDNIVSLSVKASF